MTRAPRQLPITITITEGENGLFSVACDGRVSDQLGWDEMLGQVAGLSHPLVRAARYPALTETERRAEDDRRAALFPLADRHALSLSYGEVEAISYSLTTLLCWMTGFAAALPDDSHRLPISVEPIQEFTATLKQAMRDLRQKDGR